MSCSNETYKTEMKIYLLILIFLVLRSLYLTFCGQAGFKTFPNLIKYSILDAYKLCAATHFTFSHCSINSI